LRQQSTACVSSPPDYTRTDPEIAVTLEKRRTKEAAAIAALPSLVFASLIAFPIQSSSRGSRSADGIEALTANESAVLPRYRTKLIWSSVRASTKKRKLSMARHESMLQSGGYTVAHLTNALT